MIYPIQHHYFLYIMAVCVAIANAKFGYDYNMQWMYIGSFLELCIPITCFCYIEGRNDTWKNLQSQQKQ